jgi:hypothetical protein
LSTSKFTSYLGEFKLFSHEIQKHPGEKDSVSLAARLYIFQMYLLVESFAVTYLRIVDPVAPSLPL